MTVAHITEASPRLPSSIDPTAPSLIGPSSFLLPTLLEKEPLQAAFDCLRSYSSPY